MNDGDSEVAASFATAAIPDEARFKRLEASVSGQVKSHSRHLPSLHRITVMPAGRFWSLLSLKSDLGSSRYGISADISACYYTVIIPLYVIIPLTAQ